MTLSLMRGARGPVLPLFEQHNAPNLWALVRRKCGEVKAKKDDGNGSLEAKPAGRSFIACSLLFLSGERIIMVARSDPDRIVPLNN